MRMLRYAAVLIAACIAAPAQDMPQLKRAETAPRDESPRLTTRQEAAAEPRTYVVPAGTSVPVTLEQGVSTKNTRIGDKIFCRTQFPVAIDNKIVIPPGTYVQGVVSEARRPGRVRGRGALLLHFTTMILPNGYTVTLPGSLESTDADNTQVKGKEGTLQGEGTKAKDAGTIASTAGTGAAIGGLSTGTIKGAAIGGGMGAAVGTAIAMLTRGNDVRLERGAALTMVFQRAVTLDAAKVDMR